MIDFQRLDLSVKPRYDACLMNCRERGCEYSFVNLYLWGRKRVAEMDGFLLIQAQFDRKIVYLYPVGEGNINFAAVTEACRDAGAEYLLVEQDDCNGEDPFDCLKRSYLNLRALGLE